MGKRRSRRGKGDWEKEKEGDGEGNDCEKEGEDVVGMGDRKETVEIRKINHFFSLHCFVF